MKIALQLYTIRDCISDKESFFNALEKVKTLGYDGVEFAGFHGATAEELSEKIKGLSLTPVCCHVGLDVLSETLEEFLAYIDKINCKAVALAWSDTSTIEKLKQTCKTLRKARIICEKSGVQLLYHNHDHEFASLNNIIPIQKIKEVCNLELDTFWSFVAGHNSAEYLFQNKDNVRLIHLKDGTKETKIPCALGEGQNDIKSILEQAKNLSYEWIIIENDIPTPNGIDDVSRSIKYLKSL